MKKFKVPQKSGKRVYYFEHRYGVLQEKTKNHYRLLSSLVTAVFVVGGVGVATTKVLDYRQNQKAKVSLQRQDSVVSATAESPDEAKDKHKDALLKAREDENLTKTIKSKLKDVPGGQKWSVYVRDVNSDRMASVKSDEVLEAGSLSNLFMIAPLESKYPTSKWGSKVGKDTKQTVEQCVKLSVSKLDNSCRQTVNRYANLKEADGVIQSIGFKKTSVGGNKQETTARDLGELLFRLQHSQVLGDKARRTVFDGLYRHQNREGIPASCKENCLIANITAESGSHRHDAAIVTSGTTKYVVVIMTKDASWSQISDVASDIRLALQP